MAQGHEGVAPSPPLKDSNDYNIPVASHTLEDGADAHN